MCLIGSLGPDHSKWFTSFGIVITRLNLLQFSSNLRSFWRTRDLGDLTLIAQSLTFNCFAWMVKRCHRKVFWSIRYRLFKQVGFLEDSKKGTVSVLLWIVQPRMAYCWSAIRRSDPKLRWNKACTVARTRLARKALGWIVWPVLPNTHTVLFCISL